MKRLLFIFIASVVLAQSTMMSPPLGTQIDWSNSLTKGLVGFWPMDESPGKLGTVYDLSGNGNHGTLVADCHAVPGRTGPCLDFDGNGDLVTTSYKPSSSFTASAWAKTTSSGNLEILCGWNGSDRISIEINGGNQVYLTTTNAYYERFDSLTISDGIWHHYIYTWNGSNIVFYFDGNKEVNDASGNPSDINVQATYIGARTLAVSDRHFHGQIDDVMIYDRALTASEIQQLYSDQNQIFVQEPLVVSSAEAPADGGQIIMIMTSCLPLVVILLLLGSFMMCDDRKVR